MPVGGVSVVVPGWLPRKMEKVGKGSHVAGTLPARSMHAHRCMFEIDAGRWATVAMAIADRLTVALVAFFCWLHPPT